MDNDFDFVFDFLVRLNPFLFDFDFDFDFSNVLIKYLHFHRHCRNQFTQIRQGDPGLPHSLAQDFNHHGPASCLHFDRRQTKRCLQIIGRVVDGNAIGREEMIFAQFGIARAIFILQDRICHLVIGPGDLNRVLVSRIFGQQPLLALRVVERLALGIERKYAAMFIVLAPNVNTMGLAMGLVIRIERHALFFFDNIEGTALCNSFVNQVLPYITFANFGSMDHTLHGLEPIIQRIDGG